MMTDKDYMRRALGLARHGAGFVSPNPMVGAVVVARGRIIGEGWHRMYGGPHAEVHALRSVAPEDRHLLKEATVYVTLEPCSHFGKTPPCADLIVESGVRRVVVAVRDPFPAVAGRGIKRLRDAGIEVTEGILEAESRELNRAFLTAHTLGRPFIQLKWARSSDGFIGAIDSVGNPAPVALSDALGKVWVHRGRSMADAIIVGTETVISDHPKLDVRHWPARCSPLKISFDLNDRLPADALGDEALIIKDKQPLKEVCRTLYKDHGVTSLIVEGGAKLLQSFIDAGLYDEVRRETVDKLIGKGVREPEISLGAPWRTLRQRGSTVEYFRR